MSFGSRLKEARQKKGLTQTQLAKKLNIAGSTVTGYEKDNSEPNMMMINKIIDVLGVDANFLLQDESTAINFDKTATPEEFETLVKKYRYLDRSGQEAVQYTLNHEVERMQAVQACNEQIKRLKERAESAEAKAESVPDTEMYPYPYLRKIACAGTGFLFDDIPTDTIDVPYVHEADFIIGVNGDSMEPTYYDGNLLYVRKTNQLDYGDIGIFIYAGECYVKEYGKQGLISHNPDYPNIPGNEDVRIIGEVIGKVGG
ncbi:MAG: XRE family transcriptional regulator [Eubacteriales bacterium]|nr:XRE family transcriptional regulator [Eubacteriales bacterium]